MSFEMSLNVLIKKADQNKQQISKIQGSQAFEIVSNILRSKVLRHHFYLPNASGMSSANWVSLNSMKSRS
jgi:hypothetical protein